MVASSQPFLVALDDHLLENQEVSCNSDGAGRGKHIKKGAIRRKSYRRVLMKKRRARWEGSRRPTSVIIQKRVRILRKLIPNGDDESVGLDGLFRDTADYILSLQMRVKVMQVMVQALSGCWIWKASYRCIPFRDSFIDWLCEK